MAIDHAGEQPGYGESRYFWIGVGIGAAASAIVWGGSAALKRRKLRADAARDIMADLSDPIVGDYPALPPMKSDIADYARLANAPLNRHYDHAALSTPR